MRTRRPLARRAALGLGLGALLTGMVAAQPTPPPAPVPQEPAAAPTPIGPAAEEAPPATVTPPAPAPAPPVAAKDVAPAAAPKEQVAEKPAAAPIRRSRAYDIAVLQALDKVTAETLRFEAPVGRPTRWKGLIFTVGACERSAPDEPIEDSIVYVASDSQPRAQPGRQTPAAKRAFRGWMFAASPSLNPLQHATYDAWVISCRASAPPVTAAAPAPAPKASAPAEPKVLDLPPAKGSPAAAAAPAPAPKISPPPAAAPAPKVEPAPEPPPPST